MPVRPVSSLDAGAFHRAMRRLAATKAGRVMFRPTAHRLDQVLSKLSAGKYSFAGVAAGLPSFILTAAKAADVAFPGPLLPPVTAIRTNSA